MLDREVVVAEVGADGVGALEPLAGVARQIRLEPPRCAAGGRATRSSWRPRVAFTPAWASSGPAILSGWARTAASRCAGSPRRARRRPGSAALNAFAFVVQRAGSSVIWLSLSSRWWCARPLWVVLFRGSVSLRTGCPQSCVVLRTGSPIGGAPPSDLAQRHEVAAVRAMRLFDAARGWCAAHRARDGARDLRLELEDAPHALEVRPSRSAAGSGAAGRGHPRRNASTPPRYRDGSRRPVRS